MDGWRLLGWNGSSYTELVVDNEFNISINFELGNVLEPTVNSGLWSKESSLPDDPINNAFFDHIWKTDWRSTGFNPKKGIKAKILTLSGDKIKDAFIIVKSIDYIQKNKRINFEIYSTQKSFFNDIDGRRLNELDFSEYNHIRNIDNIVLSHTYSIIKNGSLNVYDGPGDGYIYPSIIYGNTSNFYLNYNVYDLYPGIYTSTILKKIVESTGRKFKNTPLTDSLTFKMDFMPFTNEKLEISEDTQNERATNIGITNDYAIASDIRMRGSGWYYNSQLPDFTRESGSVDDEGSELIFRDDLSQFNNDVIGAFYCKNQGFYNIKFLAHGVLDMIRYDGSGNPDPGEPINYNEGSGTFELEVALFVIRTNGTHQQLVYNLIDDWSPSTGEHASPWIDDASTRRFELEADNILLAEGEVVYVKYGFRYPGDVNWGPPAFNDRVRTRLRFKKIVGTSFSKFSVTVANTTDMGNNQIDMNQVLPDMEFTDFISNLKNMYNMIIEDDGEFVSFHSYDDYFNFDSEVEWDDLWDEESGYMKIPMSEVDFSQYKLSYEKDDDMYNKEYFNSFKDTYANKSISIINDRSDKKFEKKVSFASTPVSNQYSPIIQPYFTEREDNNIKSKKVKPRILKYGGLIDVDYMIIQNYPGPAPGDFVVLNKYPYCGMWDHPFEPTYSLEFDAGKTYYFNPTRVPRLNLFEKYHKNAINNIINNEASLVEAQFYLSDKQICEFDFRKKVNWLGSRWRVNKIMDYNPGQSSKLTKVQLYKLVDEITADARNISTQLTSTSCPVDVVAKRTRRGGFIYISESGQEISESCCDLMGGTYKNGVCYANKEVPFIEGVAGPFLPNISTPNPTGPISWVKDRNTILSNGIIVRGEGNYVPSGMSSSSAMILGNNNTITQDFIGINIGDGIFGTTSGINIGTSSQIDLNGNISAININLTGNINGVPVSTILSGGGATPSLSTVLSTGNDSGGNDIIITDGDKISNVAGNSYMLFTDLGVPGNPAFGVIGAGSLNTNTILIDPDGSEQTVIQTMNVSDTSKIGKLSVGSSITKISVESGSNYTDINLYDDRIVLQSPSVRLLNEPPTDNSNDKILTRNSSTGNIELRDVSSISGGSSTRTVGTYSTTSNITTDVALAYTNTSSFTLYLPTAVGITGSEYTIKDRSGNANVNNIIISGTLSQLIDGSSTYTMRLNYESITMISDGGAWWIV